MVVEKFTVGRFWTEFCLIASPLFKGHLRFFFRSWGYTKIVDPIWISKERSIHRVYLCVFPTRFLPSWRYKMQLMPLILLISFRLDSFSVSCLLIRFSSFFVFTTRLTWKKLLGIDSCGIRQLFIPSTLGNVIFCAFLNGQFRVLRNYAVSTSFQNVFGA